MFITKCGYCKNRKKMWWTKNKQEKNSNTRISWGSMDTYHFVGVNPTIQYIWVWHWMLRKHHNESKSRSSIKELVFSRSSGWEWEERSFCAFSQSLSSLHRTCLVPREIPGGLHTAFDRHEPGFLGQIVQCNHLCFKVLRGNSSAPFPFHGMTSVVATIALSWHRTLCI